MSSYFRSHWQFKSLLPSLSIGLVFGIRNAVAYLAYALMILSGDLNPYLTIGITVLFLGGCVHSIVAALRSSYVGMVSCVQDSPSVILAVVTAAMLAGMPQASPSTKLYTALAGIIFTSLLTGLVCLLLGKYKLGNLVSYIPYPVVGGFLAGTGMLLILGAVKLMTGQNITLFNLYLLFRANTWYYWVAGAAFAIILFILVSKVNHYLVLPGAMAATIAIFYLVLALSGTPVSAAAQAGWLVKGIPPGGALFQFWNPAGFTQVDWGVLLGQSGSLLASVVVSLMALLLNTTALEISTGQDIDLNNELISSGWANLIAGAMGSVVGYPSLGLTKLAHRMGARMRVNGIFIAIVTIVILFAGGSLLGYFPNLVLGGLIFFMGLDFLAAWLYQTWFSMPRLDYAIVVTIAIIINTLGFLQGVGIGLALAVFLFVAQYSQTRAIRHTLSGANYQSSVERTRLSTCLLQHHGDWLYILELQGFIFFGTANQVLDQIHAHLENPAGSQPPHFIILDFRLVSGLDSSAAFSFAKIKRMVQERGITLVLTNVPPIIKKQLKKDLPADNFPYFSDLDHGIEWCENKMVAAFEDEGLHPEYGSLFQQLANNLPNKEDVELLQQYLKPRLFQPGERIIKQGSQQHGLYMIESGQVVVQLVCEDGSAIRLRTLGAGAFFGEMGLYSGEPASADVIAEQPTSLHVLMADDLSTLERVSPTVAASLHRFVAAYMSERLAKTNATVQALR